MPADLKVKVSLATLSYTHPKQSKREKQAVIADRYGFTVDRALATKLRNELRALALSRNGATHARRIAKQFKGSRKKSAQN